eukprot:scaffold1074_cov409-Prasinococcus_capsulatus_cf.AAC.26
MPVFHPAYYGQNVYSSTAALPLLIKVQQILNVSQYLLHLCESLPVGAPAPVAWCAWLACLPPCRSTEWMYLSVAVCK